MLRKLVILGIFAGGSAAIPSIFQANPQLLERLLGTVSGASVQNISSPAAPANSAMQQPLGRKVLIEANAGGHFLATFKINGRQVDAMVDTGATLVALNASTARRVGVSVSPADFNQQVNTANGPVKVALVRLASLQIGKIELDDVDAVIIDDRSLGTNLIGMSFLKRLDKYTVENGALMMAQ